ncbi:hypothetical protein Tco_1523149 [Tanacetum coccineum]
MDKKMHFLLSSMSVVYVLTTPIPKDSDDATVEQLRKRAKWDNNDYVCRGLIFNGMSDSLFDIYQSVESSKELWDSLDAKYMSEDASSKKFLVSNFTNYKMIDSRPDMEQYNELLGILGDFKHTLKHLKEELTLIELGSHSVAIEKSSVYYATYVSAAYFVQDDDVAWWVDSGATVHVCKDRCWFKTYESPNDGSILHMGNESTTLVHGRGCVYLRTVVRFPDLKLKTLGERGIECIFVGYAKYYEAFRFYIIEPNESISINSIIESRDVIFDENRFSSVLRLSLRIPNNTGDIGGSVVPEEVTEEVVTQQLKPELRKSKRNRTLKNFEPEFQLYLIEGKRDEVANLLVANDFKRKLKVDGTIEKFSMKDMGEVDVILGIRIKHEVSTPMDSSEKLMPNNGQAVSQLKYSRVIGCLMYSMTCTRPNIAFAVGELSRYTSNPGTQHLQAIQQVLKYLKKTMDYSLIYTGYPLVLEGYTNASWISNTEDNSSTSGWVFLLSGGKISWVSKKQTYITNSIIEYEFLALTAAGKEAE